MKEEKKEIRFAEIFGNIDNELIQQASKPWEKRRSSTLVRRRIAAAAVVLVIAGLVMATNPKVYAAIQEVFTKIGRTLGIKTDLMPYSKVINTAQSKNGITVTLKEVLIDETHMLVYLQEEADEEVFFDINSDSTTINQEKLECNGSGSHLDLSAPNTNVNSVFLSGEEGDSTDSQSSVNGGDITNPKIKDGRKIQNEVLEMTFSEVKLPEGKTDIHLRIDALKVKDSWPEIVETFDYNFTMSTEELQLQTINQPMNETIKLDEDSEVSFHQLTINPISSRISATIPPQMLGYWDLVLKGKDNNGNEVEYSMVNVTNGEKGEVLFETNLMSGSMMQMDETIEEGEDHPQLPDMESTSLELQLYGQKYEWQEADVDYDSDSDVDLTSDPDYISDENSDIDSDIVGEDSIEKGRLWVTLGGKIKVDINK